MTQEDLSAIELLSRFLGYCGAENEQIDSNTLRVSVKFPFSSYLEQINITVEE